MITSQFLVSTTLLLLAGHPALHCPRAHSDCPAAAIDGINDEVVEGPSHEPPVVSLRGSRPNLLDPSGEISSDDKPSYWTPIPLGELSVSVSFWQEFGQLTTIDSVQLFLDSTPVDNDRFLVGPQTPLALGTDGRLQAKYGYTLPCPSPGKHLLQARYLTDNQWSRLSLPLRFEVRLPGRPRIIAVSDSNRDPIPVSETGLISVTEPSVKLHLADVRPHDRVVAYLDGRPISSGTSDDTCCRTVRLEGSVTPGIHTLTVRTVGDLGSCSISSEPSNAVVFHYYDESVYLLRPAKGCRIDDPCLKFESNPVPGWILPAAPETIPSAPPSNTPTETGSSTQEHSAFPVSQALHSVTTSQSWSDADVVPSRRHGITLIAFQMPDRLGAAQGLLDQATKFRDLTTAAAEKAGNAAEDASKDAGSANDAAIVAAEQRDFALTARNAADKKLEDAKASADQANANSVVVAASAIQDANQARADAQGAFSDADAAAKAAESHAKAAQQHALDARARATDAAQAGDKVITAKALADQAVARSRLFVNEVQRHVAATNGTAAEAARKKVEAEQDITERANNEATSQLNLAQTHARAAADSRHFAETSRSNAVDEKRKADTAAQRATTAAGVAAHAALTANMATLQSASGAPAKNAASDAEATGQALQTAANSAGAAKTAAKDAAHHADVADMRTTAARAHAQSATKEHDSAKIALQEARDSSVKAGDAVREAQQNAGVAATCGDPALARNAWLHADRAKHEKALADQHAVAAANAYNAAARALQEAKNAVKDAESNAKSARVYSTRAASHADSAAKARDAAAAERNKAVAAAQRTLEAVQKGDSAAAAKSAYDAKLAKDRAENQLPIANGHDTAAQKDKAAAEHHTTLARAALDRADVAAKDAAAAGQRAHDSNAASKNSADKASDHAKLAGERCRLQQTVVEAWDQAHADEVHQQLTARADAAKPDPAKGGDSTEVRYAKSAVAEAEERAAIEQEKADARIKIALAEDKMARARDTCGPPSPFYFASAAHFPMRQFGPNGEVVDCEGAVIYEDMEFSFDRDGNYKVRFTIGTPAMPTTIRLRFLIQPQSEGPWYTVTLDPIKFPPTVGKTDDVKAQVTHDHIERGRSEILRRFYGQMGSDATIRREGNARFGYGLSGLGQSASN